MTILPQSAETLAQLGANLEITKDANYLPQSLERLVQIVAAKGNHIRISAEGKLPQTLERLVQIGGNSVTIVI